MGTTDLNSSWIKIQNGAREMERLIAKKEYNLSMVRGRQTLELMVRILCEKALIVEGDLVDVIDQLYEGRWITKDTHDHYHRIRIIGNKAVHDGDNAPLDAEQSYRLLTQEIHTFANVYARKRQRPQSQTGGGKTASGRPAAGRGSSGRTPVRSSSSRSSYRPSSRSRRRSPSRRFHPYDLVRPLVILLIIILLVAVVRLILPGKSKKETEPVTSSPVSTETAEIPTTAPPTTAPTTETPEPILYKTTTSVNVRSDHSTDSAKLATLAAGTQIEFIGEYDEEWSVIRYNGREAYINSQYIEPLNE